MPRPYFSLPILALAVLLAGCSARAVAQPAEVRVLENPTSTALPEPSVTAEITKSDALPDHPPASCPVTQAPEVPFVAPEPYPAAPPERYISQFWYGTPRLWTMLGPDPIWRDLPHNRNGYSQKIFWWSQDFDVSEDPYPAFRLIIERLDVESAPILIAEEATNASADFGTAMLTGVEIPSAGCWKITGKYADAELSFVVWVAP